MRCYKPFALFFLSLILVACVSPQPIFKPQYPLIFEVAVRSTASTLLKKAQEEKKTAKIVLDPFVDSASGEIVTVSRKIEQIILDEAQQNFADIEISRLAPHSLEGADYVFNGTIGLQDFIDDEQVLQKRYLISSSLVTVENAKIIMDAKVWILETDLDYTPIASYQDRPIYAKDELTESQIITAESVAGESAEARYYNALDTHALLVEAESIYEKDDYGKALNLFNKAAERFDGQVMKTYAGLYETYYKLNNQEDAARAFSKLLDVSIREKNRLSVKLLFEVNSTDFVNNEDLRKQYATWLQQISTFFRDRNYCFDIAGHSSKTGTVAYNEQLSLERAKRVQKLMATDFPDIESKSKTEGKGFAENIVGSGTDDAHDAIDRRVEFIVMECGALK